MTEKYSTNSDDAPRLPLGKPCNKCGEWKLYEEFSRHKRAKDGRNWTCKSCASDANRRWREANPDYRPPCLEENPNYYKEWYEENKERHRQRRDLRKEEKAEYQRQYREQNKERLAEYMAAYGRRYREENKEREAERIRRWQQANKEREAARARRRHEEKKEEISDYRRRWYDENKERINAVSRRWRQENKDKVAAADRRRYARELGAEGSYTAEEWQTLCEFYGHKCLCCGQVKTLTVDHVVPLSKGGSNDIHNLQPLCVSCNSRKSTDTIDYR